MARRRRAVDPETRWRILQHEALRTFARRHYWIILFGPSLLRLFGLLAAVAVLMFLWLKVPHAYLGVGAIVGALLVGGGWLLYTGSARSLQQRMAARAGGREPRGAGLGWAVASVVALLGATGWLSLWSPYA